MWPAYTRDEKLYLEISTQPEVKNETQTMRDIVHFWHHDFINVVLPPSNGEFKAENPEYKNPEMLRSFALNFILVAVTVW